MGGGFSRSRKIASKLDDASKGMNPICPASSPNNDIPKEVDEGRVSQAWPPPRPERMQNFEPHGKNDDDSSDCSPYRSAKRDDEEEVRRAKEEQVRQALVEELRSQVQNFQKEDHARRTMIEELKGQIQSLQSKVEQMQPALLKAEIGLSREQERAKNLEQSCTQISQHETNLQRELSGICDQKKQLEGELWQLKIDHAVMQEKLSHQHLQAQFNQIPPPTGSSSADNTTLHARGTSSRSLHHPLQPLPKTGQLPLQPLPFSAPNPTSNPPSSSSVPLVPHPPTVPRPTLLQERCAQQSQVDIEDSIRPMKAVGGGGFKRSIKTPPPEDVTADAMKVLEALEAAHAEGKVVVAQMAPAFIVTISEEIGKEPGFLSRRQLVHLVKQLGFSHVFDVRFSADVTIMEEASELLDRVKKGGPFPMFTSCCSGWIPHCEKAYPELIPNLSTCKSPMSMNSRLIKTLWGERMGIQAEQIVVVSLMPCTLKKQEAKRPQLIEERTGLPSTDHVLTTKEAGALVRYLEVDFTSCNGEGDAGEFSNVMGEGSGAGGIFGVTGGVTEAALRTAYEWVTKKPLEDPSVAKALRGLDAVKTITVKIPDVINLKVCVVSGPAVKRMLEQTLSGENPFHFVEVMMCPGGCLNGAGQPQAASRQELMKRAQAMYTVDERMVVRRSHENPVVKEVYAQFFPEGPLSEKSHRFLHTHYDSCKPAVVNETEVHPLVLPEQGLLDLVVVFGSQSGNAERCARSLAKDVSKRGVKTTCVPGNRLDAATMKQTSILVLLVSTTGHGELPDNCSLLYKMLQGDFASGGLEKLQFAVFGLGDTNYPMFCEAAIMFNRQFTACGAKRIMEWKSGNARSEGGHEGEFVEWKTALFSILQVSDVCVDNVTDSPFELEVCANSDAEAKRRMTFAEGWKPIPHTVDCEIVSVLENVSTVCDGHEDQELCKIKVNYPLRYAVGDSLMVYPRNDPDKVVDFLQWYGLEPTDIVKIVRFNDDTKTFPVLPKDATVLDIFCDLLDIFGRPTRQTCEELLPFVQELNEKAMMAILLGTGKKAQKAHKAWTKLASEGFTIADMLKRFSSAKLGLAHLLSIIPLIKPRTYCIGSSCNLTPGVAELAVLVQTFKAGNETMCGQASGFLRKLSGGKFWIACAPRPTSSISMPFNPKLPIIMAGFGCGLTVLRSVLCERQYQKHIGEETGPLVLYCGLTRKKEYVYEPGMDLKDFADYRVREYLYKEDWEAAAAKGVLSQLKVSVDCGEDAMIHDMLIEDTDSVWEMLGTASGYFFYCGIGGQAEADIRGALETCFVEGGGMDKQAAAEKIEALRKSGRVEMEIF